jgi:hypothetical protein
VASYTLSLSDEMLNIARLSCVLFCSTLYPALCTVEVSQLILSVLSCTLVTISTELSHVPLIFRQLSDTLISDNPSNSNNPMYDVRPLLASEGTLWFTETS